MASSNWERVYKMSFASVYPHYLAKAEKKGRTKAEVDAIIGWLTGYSQAQLDRVLEDGTDFTHFIDEAPRLNPARDQIKGLICGQRVEEIEEPLMREIRYLDKLIDELAKGKKMKPRSVDLRVEISSLRDTNHVRNREFSTAKPE